MTFDWRPLTLDNPSYLGSAEKKECKVVASSGRSIKVWNAIRYSYGDAWCFAKRQGLILKGTEKIWDSSISNIGILWVVKRDRDKLDRYCEAIFPPFWRYELDIEDVDVVRSCLTGAGID
jgi:2-hydroxychromene-2-carboxylate isomerase